MKCNLLIQGLYVWGVRVFGAEFTAVCLVFRQGVRAARESFVRFLLILTWM